MTPCCSSWSPNSHTCRPLAQALEGRRLRAFSRCREVSWLFLAGLIRPPLAPLGKYPVISTVFQRVCTAVHGSYCFILESLRRRCFQVICCTCQVSRLTVLRYLCNGADQINAHWFSGVALRSTETSQSTQGETER